MKSLVIWGMVICLGLLGCRKSEDAMANALGGGSGSAKNLDISRYEKAEGQTELQALPAGSVLRFSKNFILNNADGMEAKGLGYLLESGWQVTSTEAYDLELKSQDDYCILAIVTAKAYSKLEGDWMKLTAATPVTQNTITDSFNGMKVSVQDPHYRSFTVRGDRVEDLTARCLGEAAEIYFPKK